MTGQPRPGLSRYLGHPRVQLLFLNIPCLKEDIEFLIVFKKKDGILKILSFSLFDTN